MAQRTQAEGRWAFLGRLEPTVCRHDASGQVVMCLRAHGPVDLFEERRRIDD
jgi:hypothetical protein